MTYRVVLLRLATHDLQIAYARAAERAPLSAARWLGRFQNAVQALAQNPQRCVLARETGKVDVEVHELLFGKRPYVFRIVFTIDGDCVRVLRIRRAQRRFLTRAELEDALDPGEDKPADSAT